jgi:orotidine-5'-phosphate decarboxylase
VIPRPENPLVVAVDLSDLDEAAALAARLSGEVGVLKVGLELFGAHGPAAVLRLRSHGPVFLDLKLHDIPTTVGRAAFNVARLGVSMLITRSAAGDGVGRGPRRRERRESTGHEPPLVVAVTVL